MNRLETVRDFYAKLVTGQAGVPATEVQLSDAFATVPREKFIGPGLWQAVTKTGYVTIPSDDPIFLYQDIAIGLLPERHINNGQPSLHARCLAALQIKAGETLLHVGAGSGYYSAMLAKLTGPSGSVIAYEVDQALAARATANLFEYSNLKVQHRSGVGGPLPRCNVIYVNAGATDPTAVWLESLHPGGRLLFPLTSAQGVGGMLLVTRTGDKSFAARFVSQAAFIHCLGASDDETGQRLTEAPKKGGFWNVQSLRCATQPDDTCTFAGRGWWLSSSAPA
jgi:protein-L-isoaspartate(D-aspartate) O-methyltransferase